MDTMHVSDSKSTFPKSLDIEIRYIVIST